MFEDGFLVFDGTCGVKDPPDDQPVLQQVMEDHEAPGMFSCQVPAGFAAAEGIKGTHNDEVHGEEPN